MSLPLGLGSLGVALPPVLFALALVPLFLLGTRGARTAGACRALAAAAVVLALAGLRTETTSPAPRCLIAVVDESASVAGAARETARRVLDTIAATLGPDDLVGSVGFAAEARVLTLPASGRQSSGAMLPEPAQEWDRSETNLGAALAAAMPLCPPGLQPALLLFTDGNETTGSALTEAALIEPRPPVHPVVPTDDALPSVALRRLLAPRFAPEGSILPLMALVESRNGAPVGATIQIAANGRQLPPIPADVSPGLSVVRLPHTLPRGRYLLEADLLVPPGAPRTGSPVRAATTVTPPFRALVVSERAKPIVAEGLAARGVDAEVLTPGRFAARTGALGAHHVVVLENVSHAGLGAPALEAMARWVAGGGAVVATGGDHLFGDPAFIGSALERVLPVHLEARTPPRPKERAPIALYLLIDRSNSMGFPSGTPGALQSGEKMEYAKHAALAVLRQLKPRDLVGAIAFDAQAYELGPLVPLEQGGRALAARISQLQYDGGTDFKEALEIAVRQLTVAGRPAVRHVILLTDGDTSRQAEHYTGVIGALAEAGITVTTIRIGSDTANLDLLRGISRATGGTFHHVENLDALPQLLISDMRQRIPPEPQAEEPLAVPVRIADGGTILTGIRERELPRVARWASTRPKPGAEIRLYVERDGRRHPLLATWQYELGRVAVLPLDFQTDARDWPAWSGFGELWAQLVSWAIPGGLASDHHLEVERTPEGALLRLQTLDDAGGPFVVRLPGAGEVTLRRSGRRSFTAVVPGIAPRVHPVVLRTGSGASESDEAFELLVPASAASGREQRTLAPNRGLLARLAAATGGEVDPDPGTLLAARRGFRREFTPLDWFLVPLAVILLLVDIALRRLAP